MSLGINQLSLAWLSQDARYRWMVFFRVIAGFVGGYIIAAYITAVTALLLPMPRAEAVVLASMLSYLWFLGLILWAFAIKSVIKLWAIFGLLIAILALAYLLLKSVIGA